MTEYILFCIGLFVAALLSAYGFRWLLRSVNPKRRSLINGLAFVLGMACIAVVLILGDPVLTVRATSPEAGGLAGVATTIKTLFAIVVAGLPGLLLGVLLRVNRSSSGAGED